MLVKVISGGQCGADLAGVKTAKQYGIKTGGYMPKGFKTQYGNKPDYKFLYDMVEHPSDEYSPRTEENVKNSDGTIRFAFDFSSAGEKCTLRFIKKHGKPYINVNLNEYSLLDPKEIADWIKTNNIMVLNIAGNSEKTAPGTEKLTSIILSKVFEMTYDLAEHNRRCTACSLRRECNQVVTGIGPIDAKIMLVGEAPGEDEDLLGEPFMGRAGKQLDAILIDAGLERKDLYITNTVRCRPTEKGGRFKKNRPPTPEEINACKHWLWKEIQKINPSAIVTLGKTPTGLLLALKPTFTLGKIVGRKFNVKYTNGVIVPAHHPSYLMQHGKDKIQDTIDIFKSVRDYVQSSSS